MLRVGTTIACVVAAAGALGDAAPAGEGGGAPSGGGGGAEAAVVLDDTPLSKALGYARNQRAALSRFLDDGRLPLDNNISERNLRREVLGRKNWLFLGSDEGARVNTIFVSLLASCQLHHIEPWAYLRDLFCLLPDWPASRILDLAPAFWKQTLQQPETQQRLAANVLRAVTLADHPSAV